MLIYLLFVLLLVLLVLSYFHFKKDIVHPSVLFLAVYTFSVFCALFNVEKWNIDLSYTTFLILLGGALEFLIISLVVDYFFKKKKIPKEVSSEESKNIELFDKQEKKLDIFSIILIIYDSLILGILIYNIVKIASSFGSFSGISDMLNIYKDATSYTTNARLPKYVTILLKPFVASTYICYYVFLKRILVTKFETKKKFFKLILKKSFHLIPILLFIISTFLQSNREGIIIVVFNLFIMTVIFWYKKNYWTKEIKPSFILKIIGVCIIGLIVFFFSAKWVGRENEKGMFDYITFYCGGSIECLNQYVKEPTDISIVRGEETFYNLIHTLDSFKITNYDLTSKMTVHKEFRYYNGEMIGNVYTGYRRWLHDYGIVGMIILQFIFATIINLLYYSTKYTNNKKILNNFLIILYSYLSYTIYLHSIDDYFYFDVLGQASFAVIACLIIEYLIVCKIEKKLFLKKKFYNN